MLWSPKRLLFFCNLGFRAPWRFGYKPIQATVIYIYFTELMSIFYNLWPFKLLHFAMWELAEEKLVSLISGFTPLLWLTWVYFLKLEVQAPPGTTIGYVTQDWHPCYPKFSIKGANKETLMKLEGPCLACNCCGDVHFEVWLVISEC